jgi:para-aminobenzoate synthetase/4-amino-4-deoxychorismate lyase
MNAELDFLLPDGRRWTHRFDFPQQILRADRLDEVQGCLRAARQAAEAGAWVLGFVAYEASPAFDPRLQVKPGQIGPLALFAVFSEAQQVSGGALPGPFEVGPWTSVTSRERFDRAVAGIREDIRNGRYYQTNFTRRLSATFEGDALGLYRALHNAQPGNFSVFLDWGEGQLASVSPELFFHWQPAVRTLMSRPMKGTAPRGRHPDDDARLAAELAADPKERAENVMIVDLLRNDLGRVAESGSVHVSDLFRVEALPSVWQMTSTVNARARPEIHLEEVFAALFPCGSVTGAPKGTAMQAIAAYEDGPRGVYCGALGVIAPGGEAIFNVPIRTVQIERARSRALCGIGSGVTWSSHADGEWAEWQSKRRFLWRATAGFSVLETLRLQDGEFGLRPSHLARIADSARYFGFPWRLAQVEQLLQERARQHPEGAWRVRLLVDRHGTVRAEVHSWSGPIGSPGLPDSPPETRLRVALADCAFVEDPDFVRHKTTWRPGYERFAPTAPEIFDTLLWNAAGELTEFTRGNLAVCIDRCWYTPLLSSGLLPGVRRQALVADGALRERVLTRADLDTAEQLVFFNALRGCLAVELV